MSRRRYRARSQTDESLNSINADSEVSVKPKIMSGYKDTVHLSNENIVETEPSTCGYCGVELESNFTRHAEDGCAFFTEELDPVTHQTESLSTAFAGAKVTGDVAGAWDSAGSQWDSAVDWGNNVGDVADNQWDSAVDWSGDALDATTSWGNDVGGDIADGATEAWDTLTFWD